MLSSIHWASKIRSAFRININEASWAPPAHPLWLYARRATEMEMYSNPRWSNWKLIRKQTLALSCEWLKFTAFCKLNQFPNRMAKCCTCEPEWCQKWIPCCTKDTLICSFSLDVAKLVSRIDSFLLQHLQMQPSSAFSCRLLSPEKVKTRCFGEREKKNWWNWIEENIVYKSRFFKSNFLSYFLNVAFVWQNLEKKLHLA